MQFSFTAIALFGALFLGATAAPVDLAARALSSQAYDELSISAGTAGTGKEEALAKIPIDMTDLAAVSAADLKIIDNIHKVANAAETGAFNAAIKAATGDAATALQNGKIKNKILKLTAAVLAAQIEVAQGNAASQATVDAESKKLAKNIAIDVKAAGQASTAVSFTGSS